MPQKLDQPGALGLDDVSVSTDGVMDFGYNIGSVALTIGTIVTGIYVFNRGTQLIGVQSETDAPVNF